MDFFKCSFCSKEISKFDLISGNNNSYICKNCVSLCNKLLKEKQNFDFNEKSPKELKKLLDDYVIGQDDAKKILSVAISMHFKRLKNKNLDKSNILLIGPTGSGKTLMMKILSEYLDLPLVITDATSLTEAGYVGDDVENILLRLIQKSNYDINKAEQGIIYIDEIDKIGKRTGNVSITRDVSGEGVQQALLKIIEGTIANVPYNGGRKHPNQPCIQINTKNILFICGGSFSGINEIIDENNNINSIGFYNKEKSSEKNYNLNIFDPNYLIQFGMIPEFIGRLPIIAKLSPLNHKMLLDILFKPKNSIIKQYKKMFEIYNINIEFENDSLNFIVDQALKMNTGARALRNILETIFIDIIFNFQDFNKLEKIIITKEYIEKKDLSFLKLC